MRALIVGILILFSCSKAEYAVEDFRFNVYDPNYSGPEFIVLEGQSLSFISNDNIEFYRFELNFSIVEELFHEVTTVDWYAKNLDTGVSWHSADLQGAWEDFNEYALLTLDGVTPGDELNLSVSLRVGFAETSRVNFTIIIE